MKIGDILLIENVTKIDESTNISIKKSQKLSKIQGNHQNW